jgi:YD repeat-containing protein
MVTNLELKLVIGISIFMFIVLTANGQDSCVNAPPQPSQCYTHFTWATGETFWPRNAQCTCVAEPGGYQDCWVTNAECAPAPAQKCPWCGGAPIDFASGDTYVTQTDIKIPGLGGGLTLQRTWNSLSPENPPSFGVGPNGTLPVGMFGPGWTSNFEENVWIGSDGYMKQMLGSGDVNSFGFSGVGSGNSQFVTAGRGSQNTVLTQTPSNWTLALPNGSQELFDGSSGKLLSLTDRNGNITTLTYDSSFRLITVTDPVSRHLYFSYASPSSYLVTNVTSDFGISLSYLYDSLGRLIQYTKPDNTIVMLLYNDQNPLLVTTILDSNGIVLETHTYNECAQGVMSARANGVETINVSYPLQCHLSVGSD